MKFQLGLYSNQIVPNNGQKVKRRIVFRIANLLFQMHRKKKGKSLVANGNLKLQC